VCSFAFWLDLGEEPLNRHAQDAGHFTLMLIADSLLTQHHADVLLREISVESRFQDAGDLCCR